MSTLKWLMLRILSAVNCLFFLDYVNEASLELRFVYMQWVRRWRFYFYWRNAVAKDRKLIIQPNFCRLLILTATIQSYFLWYVEFQIIRKSDQASVSVSVSALCAVRAVMDISNLLIVRCGNGPHTTTPSTSYEYNVFSSVLLSQISL